jgi:hypothetical protein
MNSATQSFLHARLGPARKLLCSRDMTKQDTQRAVEILAKSVYRDLKQNGYARADIVAFASSILEQLTNDAKSEAPEAAANGAA